MANYEALKQAVKDGNQQQVQDLVQGLIDAGNDPNEIINEGLIGGMNIVAPLFKAGEMYVPEVLMCAQAMAAGIELVKPLIADTDAQDKGVVVIGTVKGDLHDIGKNLVSMMMESTGLKVIDIGIDMSVEKFADAVREHKPDIVAMSALLTTTMPAMQETIDHLKAEGLRDKLKVIVGGAPVSQEFADQIGADGYAADAASAADLCKELLGA